MLDIAGTERVKRHAAHRQRRAAVRIQAEARRHAGERAYGRRQAGKAAAAAEAAARAVDPEARAAAAEKLREERAAATIQAAARGRAARAAAAAKNAAASALLPARPRSAATAGTASDLPLPPRPSSASATVTLRFALPNVKQPARYLLPRPKVEDKLYARLLRADASSTAEHAQSQHLGVQAPPWVAPGGNPARLDYAAAAAVQRRNRAVAMVLEKESEQFVRGPANSSSLFFEDSVAGRGLQPWYSDPRQQPVWSASAPILRPRNDLQPPQHRSAPALRSLTEARTPPKSGWQPVFHLCKLSDSERAKKSWDIASVSEVERAKAVRRSLLGGRTQPGWAGTVRSGGSWWGCG